MKGQLEVQWTQVHMDGAQSKGAKNCENDKKPAYRKHECVQKFHSRGC